MYVGHTTNFIQRKYLHKIASKDLNNKLKIYNTIRCNGGWENWDMIEIAKYNCKDATEARIKEYEHYDNLRASLNSCPPYVDIKKYFCSICNLQCSGPKQYNKHINCLKHITKTKENISVDQLKENQQKIISTTVSKFYCEKCKYFSNRKYNFNIHLNSIKHKYNISKSENNRILEKNNNQYECLNCNKLFNDRAGIWRHKKKCIVNEKKQEEPTDKQIIMLLIKENSELRKYNSTIKELILEIVKNRIDTTIKDS